MKPPLAVTLLLLALVPACSREESGDGGATASARTPEELLGLLDGAVAELAQRPEHGAERVTVQHVLVGVAGGATQAQRSPAEARLLAAEILDRARAGEDFDLLVKNHTDESHPGIYTLVLSGGDGLEAYDRAAVGAGFGDLAWRLGVGEIGVVPYDGDVGEAARSPHGFDVLKRLR